jgi:ribosomal protein S18 acetylase RimI-like enzyme
LHTLFAYLLFCAFLRDIVALLVVSPPSSIRDYRQLASLIVDTFDAPDADSAARAGNQNRKDFQSKIDALRWNVLEKSLTEEFTFKQYISTMRRMRGKKYCLLVAKECCQDENDKQQMRVRDDVVGIVEMGMSLCPTCYRDTYENNEVIYDAPENESKPQPTLGVLCVKSAHRQKGIGQALVEKCERVAADLWSEDHIFVDVDPDNPNALSFFIKCGYNSTPVDESESLQMRNATVSRRRKSESKPHYLLRKILRRTTPVI